MVDIVMSPVQISNNLYVGDIGDVRNGDTSEFDAIVGVCQNDCSDNVSCEYFHFALQDGVYDSYGDGEFTYELFEDAVDTALKQRIMRKKVLVHCHAGISRSATVAVTTLAILKGLSWNEAFNEAKDRKSNINPNQEIIEFAKRYIEQEQDEE